MDGGLRVLRRDADGGVLPGRRRPADEQREVHPAPLHLLRDDDHLIELIQVGQV